jgi:capsid portal protein
MEKVVPVEQTGRQIRAQQVGKGHQPKSHIRVTRQESISTVVRIESSSQTVVDAIYRDYEENSGYTEIA